MHRDQTQMRMRDIGTGGEEGDALDTVDRLHGARDILRQGHGAMRKVWGQIVEIGVMGTGQDHAMPGPDRHVVKDHEKVGLRVEDDHRSRVLSDPAKRATLTHGQPSVARALHSAASAVPKPS